MLQFEDVSVHFGTHHIQAVDHVTFTVSPLERCVMVGETGSGKSVLLLSALGLLPSSARCTGRIVFQGENLLAKSQKQLGQVRGKRIGYVPQGGGNSLDPFMRVGEQIAEGITAHHSQNKHSAWQKAVGWMEKLNIPAAQQAARQYPHTFSGGMRQRALIAMGVAAGAGLILADEPTKGLDRFHVERVAQAFLKLEDTTLLCVTHDLSFAQQLATAVAVLYAGQLVEYSPAQAFFASPLHPYSQALVAAMPQNGMRVLSGFAPSNAGASANGCRFGPRCSHYSARCQKAPPLLGTNSGRKVACWLYDQTAV